MRARLILLWVALGVFIFSSAAMGKDKPGSHQGFVAGDFDSYVLALSWEPVFCETKKDKKECRDMKADSFQATNLVLHGLWPNKDGDNQHQYGYCGVDAKTRQMGENSTQWCNLDAPNLSEDTKEKLSMYMPGAASCLERHEWYRHGTCSDLGQDAYFAAAEKMTERMATTKFAMLISASVGSRVQLKEMVSAIEKDFGSGSGKFITLYCNNNELSGIELQLVKDFSPDMELSKILLRRGGAAQGHCPSSILIKQGPDSVN